MTTPRNPDTELGTLPSEQGSLMLGRAIVALAKYELLRMNMESDDPKAWPAQQDWPGIGSSSRGTFVRLACDRAGIDQRAFWDAVREVEDWDDNKPLPPIDGAVSPSEEDRTLPKEQGDEDLYERIMRIFAICPTRQEFSRELKRALVPGSALPNPDQPREALSSEEAS